MTECEECECGQEMYVVEARNKTPYGDFLSYFLECSMCGSRSETPDQTIDRLIRFCEIRGDAYKKIQAELAQLKYLEHLVTHTNKRVIPGEKDSIDALVDYIKKLEEKCDDYTAMLERIKRTEEVCSWSKKRNPTPEALLANEVLEEWKGKD